MFHIFPLQTLCAAFAYSARNNDVFAAMGDAEAERFLSRARERIDGVGRKHAAECQFSDRIVRDHEFARIVAIELSDSVGKRGAMENEMAAAPGKVVREVRFA